MTEPLRRALGRQGYAVHFDELQAWEGFRARLPTCFSNIPLQQDEWNCGPLSLYAALHTAGNANGFIWNPGLANLDRFLMGDAREESTLEKDVA